MEVDCLWGVETEDDDEEEEEDEDEEEPRCLLLDRERLDES